MKKSKLQKKPLSHPEDMMNSHNSNTKSIQIYDNRSKLQQTTFTVFLASTTSSPIKSIKFTMSSLSTNFSRFIDLTINPSHGTINTTLLHALLHLIIDQMQLSSSLIQFYGIGSGASIENQILLDDNQQRCRLEVKQFEIKQEIDTESSRKEVNDATLVPRAQKVFAITSIDCNMPTDSPPPGYPLNPIQSISIEQFKKFDPKVNGIHDLIATTLPPDSSIIKDEKSDGGAQSSMRTLIDVVNATKRIDALEIVVRQMAALLKEIQCESNELKVIQRQIESKIGKLGELSF
jgi:hypothetical protein